MKKLLLILAFLNVAACQTVVSNETAAEYNQRLLDRELQDLKATFKSDYQNNGTNSFCNNTAR